MTAHEPTVFVLDDDPAIRDSLSQLLQAMKLPAEFFTSVSEFLEGCAPSRRGCLLLDLRLPGDGFELMKKLAVSKSTLPIIVITGHGAPETRDRANKLGAVAYFEKPFDGLKLCECIQQVIKSEFVST